MKKKIKAIYNHVIRWNVWRKRAYVPLWYKLMILLGLMHSPTFCTVFTPEEITELKRYTYKKESEDM